MSENINKGQPTTHGIANKGDSGLQSSSFASVFLHGGYESTP